MQGDHHPAISNLTIEIDLSYILSRMLPNKDDLSPDLEWMLQSGQVDDRTLIETLVKQYYSTIYHLALPRLEYPEEAHQVTQAVFVRAVLEPSTFRGKSQVKDWLAGFLDEDHQQQDAEHQVWTSTGGYPGQTTKIRQAYETITPDQLELAVQAISSKVRKRKKEQSRKVLLQIAGVITAVVLLTLILVRTSSDLSVNSLTEATRTSKPTNPMPTTSPTSTSKPRENQVELSATPVPLSLDSKSAEIRERIKSSSQYWDTMWAELIVMFFGPRSYAGQPYAERHQIWIDPQQGGLLVSGPVNEFPDQIERILVPSEFDQSSWSTTDYFSSIGSQIPWFAINIETLYSFPFAINFTRNLPITGGDDSLRFSPVSTGFWAGKRVLIVDLLTRQGTAVGQLYLDPATGIALREQYYYPGPGRKVIIESSLQQLEFNQPMPNMWKGPDLSLLSPRIYLPEDNPMAEPPDSWLNTPGVNRETIETAPENLDITRAYLVFSQANPLVSNQDGFTLFKIFADGYLIGEVELSDPLKMICTRSSDGRRIGFAEWAPFPGDGTDHVSWFDLVELELSTLNIPEMTVRWIGFSPDGGRLGISGFNAQDSGETFILLDLDNGSMLDLPIPASYQPIAWSPDGNQLLVLNEDFRVSAEGPQRTLSVYSAVNGQLLDTVEIDHPPPYTEDLKIPFEGSEITFNQLFQDTDSCAPPQ